MNTDRPSVLETLQQTTSQRRRRLSLGGPVVWCVAAVAMLVFALVQRRIPHGRAGLIGFLACIVIVVVLNSAHIVRRIKDAHTKN